MKFIMMACDNKNAASQNKILITDKLCLGVLIEYRDFNPNDEYIKVCGHHSVQIRPKTVYKNKKGYFYKNTSNETTYLDIKDVEFHTKKFINYCINR